QLTVREADLAECGQDGLRGDAVLRRFPPIAHQRVKVRVARRPREADAHQGPDVEPRDGQKGRRPRARDLQQKDDAPGLRTRQYFAKGRPEVGHVAKCVSHAEEVERPIRKGPFRASRSMPELGSSPTTEPVGPTSRSAAWAVRPGPHPTSSTRIPA